MELYLDEFLISDDKTLIQPEIVFELFSKSYWAGERSLETIKKSIENSLCFGVYHVGKQVGFARCVTDYATIYWLADVIIDERFRGQGLRQNAYLRSSLTREHQESFRHSRHTRRAYAI